MTTTEIVVDRLKMLTTDKVLLKMALDGQVLQIRCETPFCYCTRGPNYFEKKGATPTDWILTYDHHPQLASDKGRREAGNGRLAHRLCNNLDYGMRTKIRALLNKGRSLEYIAGKLNGRVPPPNRWDAWTAARVRKVWIS